MLLELLAHTNTVVGDRVFIDGDAIRWLHLAAHQANIAALAVVLDGIAGNIEQQTLEVRHAHPRIGMIKRLLVGDNWHQTLLGLALQNIAHLVVEGHQICGNKLQVDLPALQATHIERLASASPEIIAVLDTMSKRDQLDLLPKVAAAFKYVAEEDEDVVGVTVTTAIPLDDELRQTITKKCEQDFGRKVFLIEQVDPSIVGGLVLEARGERRDISVKTQLRIAQETLANSANSYGGEA